MSLVLVTGGAGFIGSHTVDRLVSLGYDVRILDSLEKPVHTKGKPDYLNPKAEFVMGDVRDRETLRRCLKDVEFVFHLAAYQDYLPDFSKFFDVNVVGTANIYELIVQHRLPVKKVILASSQFVQGEGLYQQNDGTIVGPSFRSLEQLERGQWDFIGEDGAPLQWQWVSESYANPPNSYAISKFNQELIAMKLGGRYGIPSVAMRYSIVQGSRQSFYNAYSGACRIFSLSYFLRKAPTIYEDGHQVRDFVNIHDVVDANILALSADECAYQVYCVGGGRAYSVKEFDRIVARIFGKEEIVPRIPGEFRFGDTRHACSDISKLRALGWSPKQTAEESVEEYKNYLEAQNDINDILEYAENQMKSLNVVRSVSKDRS